MSPRDNEDAAAAARGADAPAPELVEAEPDEAGIPGSDDPETPVVETEAEREPVIAASPPNQSPYVPPPAATPSAAGPAPESGLGARPEVLVGAAFAGGVLLAILLRRLG